MPKAFEKSAKQTTIQYPPGCRELSDDLNKDELLKRLKMLARAFQDMGQDENNKYSQLAIYLATEFFMENSNKDVRLLVACCVADVFRIFAPEAPYTDAEHLKEIFMFVTKQLRGLEDTEAPSFKRYFYLLENLAWVKSFNICIELEDNQEIFCMLYTLMFSIVNEKHSSKVINFMLDMMCPLITEADAVSQELLDIILRNILEPSKTQNRHAYNLARDLIRRTANAIEPYIQTFFNNALMLGKHSESELSGKLFNLVYELNMISPSVLLAVLPQLEFKLKSNDEKERKDVTTLLAKMFSDPDSDLAVQNKPLWHCFLGRFNDIDIEVRRTCVQSSQDFIVNHPDLVSTIADPLKSRQHDPDENVRMDVVQAIIGAAKRDFSACSDDLLNCVKERTLDKKFKIRREALMGLGQVYKRCTEKLDIERVSWIRNKVLHTYYQNNMDDKILVERILNTSLVPYALEPADRMKRLYHLYGNIDDHAVKALQEIFKMQRGLRNVVRNLLELHTKDSNAEVQSMIQARLNTLSKNLPDPPKAIEYMKKFNKMMKEDKRIRGYLIKLVSLDCSCKKALECVKEIMAKMGNNVAQNYLYGNVRTLLERIAPVMIDSTAVQTLMAFIDDAKNDVGELVDDMDNAVEKGMKLLLMLSHVFPGSFQSEEIFTQLIAFVKHDDEVVSDITMEIFAHIGQRLEHTHPQIYSSLLPVLKKMVKIGTPKQTKHAIQCISTLCKNKDKIFAQVFEHLKKNMDLESPYFLSTLVAVGHISKLCPGEFGMQVKGIVSKFVVKELLMQDRTIMQSTEKSWYEDKFVSEETQAKIQALKMIVRWLIGLRTTASNSAASTLRLVYTMVQHNGDLMERGKINKAEMARLRLAAGCALLKLAQEPMYADLISLEQFQTLALLLNDPCYQVRFQIAQKLHKGLINLKLPLQYLSMLCLAANDPLKERRLQAKQFLASNVNRRREYLKQNATANAKIFSLLPDYVLPYAIHLLAHDPELSSHQDVNTLKNIKECLWLIMEPLITKNENYSYSFYRRMIENIKQTKDKQNPEDEEANKKLYAVCDLALGLVMTKTANFVLKDFPAEPVLPAKLFTQPDQNYSNTKNYLPTELQLQAKKNKPAALGLSPPSKLMPASTTDKEKVNGSSPGSSEAGSEASTPSPSIKTYQRGPRPIVLHPPTIQSVAATKQTTPVKPAAKPSKTTPKPKARSRAQPEEEDDDEEEEVAPKSPPKRRGRPPKVRPEEEEDEEEEEEEEEQKSPPKRRGRPPKVQPEEEEDEEEEEEEVEQKPPPKRRGRPPKSASKLKSKKEEDESSSLGSLSPASSSSSASNRRKSTKGKTVSKNQGKITDFVTRSGRASRDSIKSSSQSTPQGKGRGRGRKSSSQGENRDNSSSDRGRPKEDSASSPAVGKRKRSPDLEPSPSKKTKTRGAVRNLSPDLDSESNVRSSPRKRIPTEKALNMDTPTKRRRAPMMNGTSDGEDRTPTSSAMSSPSSSTPPKKRAAALARAAEQQAKAKEEQPKRRANRGRRK